MRAKDLGLMHFLLPLKVLGGLPYYRTDVGEGAAKRASSGVAGEKEERGQQVPSFRKSKFWIAWSAVMGLVSVTYFGMGIWGLLQPQCPFSINLVTVALAGKINDLGDLIMLNLIVFYVIRNSPLLLRTISSFFVLFNDAQISVGKVSSEADFVAPALVALVASLVIVVSNFVYADMTDFPLYLTTIYEVVLATALGLTLTFLNKWFTHLLVKVYEGIGNMVEDSPPPPPRSNPTAALTEPAGPWPDNPLAEGGDPVFEELSVAPRRQLTLEIVLRMQRKAAMVIEVHNLMNEYFGFPVAILMLHSIFTLILACFYLSFTSFLNALDLVACICYIVEPTLIIVLLCDMPQKLEHKVS